MKRRTSRRVRRAAHLAHRLRTAAAEQDRARLFLAESTGDVSEETYRRSAQDAELRMQRLTIRARRALDRVPQQNHPEVEEYLQTLLWVDSIVLTPPNALFRRLR